MEKILLITLEYPPQKGGVASYYFGLVEELKKRGFDVEVISNSPTSPSPPSGRGGKSEVLLYHWIWPRWLRAYFVLKRAIKKIQPDLIFVGQVLPLGTVAYLLRKKVPYVVFTHGMDVLSAQKSLVKRRLAKKILQQAKFVVANSEFTKGEVLKFVRGGSTSVATEVEPPRVAVVYPCPTVATDVSIEDIEFLRGKLGLHGKKVLLTLGRVVERKGQDMVIKALPEILKHIPNVVYVVAGDGPYLDKLQKLVIDPHPVPLPRGEVGIGQKEGLGSCVRFVGQISEKEKSLYYSLCDLFVMPCRQIGSDVEGFGTVFLEAAMFGKTSIGGNSGGISEAILNGKTGALVNPEDSDEIARTIARLLRDNDLREELGQNAKSRVFDEFTWKKQIGVLINSVDQNN